MRDKGKETMGRDHSWPKKRRLWLASHRATPISLQQLQATKANSFAQVSPSRTCTRQEIVHLGLGHSSGRPKRRKRFHLPDGAHRSRGLNSVRALLTSCFSTFKKEKRCRLKNKYNQAFWRWTTLLQKSLTRRFHTQHHKRLHHLCSQ